MGPITFRRARPDEAQKLTALAFAAKRYWGYPEALIELWRGDLEFTPALIREQTVTVAEEGGTLLAVSALSHAGETAELEHLWVHPSSVRRGLGRALFERAVGDARALGSTSLIVVSDPNAEPFYARMGASRAGMVASTPRGRRLPRLVLPIRGEAKRVIEGRIRRDLTRIGVARGMTLMVHSSLSAIGSVADGAPSVVRALIDGIGEDGTLVMPAATPQCGEPVTENRQSVSCSELADTRRRVPLFDRETTPTAMGAIPESFRTWPGTLRSDHPLESVCARGPLATRITREHPLAFSEGRGGPFGVLHDLDAWILLLGVGFNRCTALHFAESLVEKRRVAPVWLSVLEEGHRVWLEVPNVADDNDTHFPVVGREFLATGRARRKLVGAARCTLFRMRDLVDVAVRYFEETL